MTAMGIIGIKIWINKGEIMEHDPYAQEKRMNAQDARGGQGRGAPRGGQRGGPRGKRANA
jgi:small subunit ribosomal protein S3